MKCAPLPHLLDSHELADIRDVKPARFTQRVFHDLLLVENRVSSYLNCSKARQIFTRSHASGPLLSLVA